MTITVTVLAAAIAFVLSAVSGKFLIPYLHKLKFGQTINDIGPTWHKNKQGTPTMGGFMFIIGTLAAVGVGAAVFYATGHTLEYAQLIRFLSGIFIMVAFGMIGFFDDYIKVVKKRNLGLTEMQKIVLQVLVTAVYLLTLQLSGAATTVVDLPFFGQLDFGFLYWPFMAVLIIGFVNAVNLTDGIDGLCGSVTFVYAVTFIAIGGILANFGSTLTAAALAGGILGFLIYNFHPAKVFMGDTGSMFLGGGVVALCFMVDSPLLIFLAGMLYLIEAFSVILQVLSVKIRGKRIFKMSPIHHHFEMCKWSEVKIVSVFSAFTLVCCVIAVLGVVVGK